MKNCVVCVLGDKEKKELWKAKNGVNIGTIGR
jgi:hypothetical protein